MAIFKTAEEKVIEAIQQRHPKERDCSISRVIPDFLNGKLYVVDVLDGDRRSENFVYFMNDVQASFLTMDELANWVSHRGSAVTFEGITATIAILIVLLIGAVVIVGLMNPATKIEVPEILGHALTTILGFYFGSQVKKTIHETPTPKPRK